MRLATLERGDPYADDVLRRREVRLADLEVHDVTSRALELARAEQDVECALAGEDVETRRVRELG